MRGRVKHDMFNAKQNKFCIQFRIVYKGDMRKTVYIKDASIGVRLEQRHKHLIEAAARSAKKKLSEYIVDTLLLVAAGEYTRKGAK